MVAGDGMAGSGRGGEAMIDPRVASLGHLFDVTGQCKDAHAWQGGCDQSLLLRVHYSTLVPIHITTLRMF